MNTSAAPTAASAPAERAAWMDVLGLWILAWPERWSSALACAAALALLVPAFWRAARSARAARAVGQTVGAMLVVLVVATFLGWCAKAGAAAAGTTTHDQPMQTLALNWLVWIGVGVLILGAGAFVARRSASTAATAFAGVWTVWAVAACAGAFLLPAVSPLLVVPVALAALGSMLASRGGTRSAVIWGSLAGLVGSVFAWAPLEPAFLDALGMTLAPATALRATLVLAPLLPLVVLRVGPRGDYSND